MSREPSPLGAALDLFVYAPVGLAVTIGEELPKLADKGRARMAQRVTAARLVGQFAVSAGRHHLARQVDGWLGQPQGGTPGSADGSSDGSAVGGVEGDDVDNWFLDAEDDAAGPAPAGLGAPSVKPGAEEPPEAGTVEAEPGAEGASAEGASAGGAGAGRASTGRAGAGGASTGRAGAGGASTGGASAGGAEAPAADALAIPGYTSLSASQVVQRLAGLSRDELEAVRVFEKANRGRRTILARVAQLQGR